MLESIHAGNHVYFICTGDHASPFTMLHPEGIRGVFNPKEIEEIFMFTQRVLAA